MKRAVIYARFSSDRQNEKSCQDQIELCSAWAESQGFIVVETFNDQAVSGASTVNRFGLARLMQASKEKKFDIVICEALDRLSRDQADLGQIRKELAFHDVTMHTVQDGEVGTIHVGIKGLMGELYLADLAQKTRRGLRSVVKDGRQAGGRSYGYSATPGKPGEMTVNEEEAIVVQRIFTEYATGSTPRQIATSLNLGNIPSPRGGKWNASTINGSKSRQNGILQNRLYTGKIVWNRQRFIKDPATGKRVSRVNPESEWLISEAPKLRIINTELFEKVRTLKEEKGKKPSHKSQRARHVLSGLLKCGSCGASYTIIGRNRLGCAGHKERGDCDNNRTVTRNHIEARVLSALRDYLAAPDLIAEYVKVYHQERNRLQKAERSNTAVKQKRLREVSLGIERIIDKIVDGTAPDVLVARLQGMEDEKKSLEAALLAAEETSAPIELHPAQAEKYRRIVANLHEHLDSIDNDASRDEIFTEIRKLIEKVVITPAGERQPVSLEVHGKLAALLSIPGIKTPYECRGVMVAGARNNQPPTFMFVA